MTSKKVYRITFTIIFILFIFMHVYRIGDLPYGIQCDEMGMGYDAWCLANYGTDRYQNSFPVYLINFSGGQSALYAYLCAPLVGIFGFSATIFRIPAIICSFVIFYFGLKTVYLIYDKNKTVTILCVFLYTIFPIFTMLFRTGLDCILMAGGSIVFIYLLIRAIDQQHLLSFVLAGIIGGLTLYTYALSHMVMPLYIFFMLIYLIYIKRIDWKKVIALGMPLFFFAVPLILFHIVNMFEMDSVKLGIFTIPKLYRYRSDDISFAAIKNNILLFFKYTLGYDGVTNIGIKRFATMYYASIPFVVLGGVEYGIETVRSIRRKVWNSRVCIFLWFLAMFSIGIVMGSGGPQAYRMNAVFYIYLIFCVEGICIIYKFIREKKAICSKFYVVMLIMMYSILFISFAKYYFCEYTNDTYLLDYYNFKLNDVLDYLDKQSDDVAKRTTYIGDVSFTYIYFLGSKELAPSEYNTLQDDSPYALDIWTQSFENYRFNFPEEFDPTGNYIIPETSQDYIDICRNMGMEETHIGQYYVYINPWLSGNINNGEALISWDHGLDESGVIQFDDLNHTVLSGWSLDVKNGKIWDYVILKVDNNYIVADKMSRNDVAEMLSVDGFTQCGFYLDLDTELIKNSDKIQIFFINYHDQSCYIQELK